MLRRIFEVGRDPFEYLSLFNQSMVFSPASFSRGFCASPIKYGADWKRISYKS
jgi:hypothetical protein